MIIIWGSRAPSKNLEEGRFYCPQCDEEGADYTLKQSRLWFTLYFIPVFPIGSPQRYVECRGCRGTFREEVLDLAPPTAEDRIARKVEDALVGGLSLEACERGLTDRGLTTEKAREIVDDVAGKGAWACPECGEHYVREVERCEPCSRR